MEKIIELTDISQSYDGGKTKIIQNLNLIVEDKPGQGQFVVIMGKSGCGKSTLLRYIAGLQKPTHGSINIHNKPISDNNRVSMVFQQYSSLPWLTVLENIALPLTFKGLSTKDRESQAMEMIKLVGLEGHHSKYAKAPTLSGGQLQRVAIARSLLANSEILLMDEPFGALDVNTRLSMQDLLIQLWEKFHSTILFVTHDITEAVYLGDELVIMSYAPSYIAHNIKIDLPLHREMSIKKTPRFSEIVQQVEEILMTNTKK